jgi:hypothetical protein
MPFSPRRSRLVDWSCRFYKVLVRAYSPPFRAAYGDEMVQVFGDCCLAAHHREGPWGLCPVWGHALLDLLHNAPADRAQDVARDHGARRLFLALTPLAVVLAGWVCWVDAHNGDLHSPVLLLLLFTTLLAFAQPRLAGLWGFAIGACVPLGHAWAHWQGWQLAYPTDGWTPVFALLALVPALGGATAGALLRALVTCVRANLRTLSIVVVLCALSAAAGFQGIRALDREPAPAVARLQHDPWQAFARQMDLGIFMFRPTRLSANEFEHMNTHLMASPQPAVRTMDKFEGKEKQPRQPRDVSRDPNWNHPRRAGLAAE